MSTKSVFLAIVSVWCEKGMGFMGWLGPNIQHKISILGGLKIVNRRSFLAFLCQLMKAT